MSTNATIDFDYALQYFSTPGPNTHVQLEHTYSLPLGKGPSNSSSKHLFSAPLNEEHSSQDADVFIDVESDFDEIPAIPKLCCDTAIDSTEITDHDEKDWVEKIDKKGWTTLKLQLFRNAANILEADYIARLSSFGLKNALIKTRLSTNKTALRLRRLFSSVSWNIPTLHWLHGLLLDNLPKQHRTAYQEALQCLETKVPSNLIESITSLGRVRSASDIGNKKTHWDPFLPSLSTSKLSALPGPPVMLFLPIAPSANLPPGCRLRKMMTVVSHMSSLVAVTCPKSITSSSNVEVAVLIEQIIQITRSKLLELRNEYPNRPVILVGFDSMAAVACQVAVVEKVSAVVCLGFHLYTISGKRGTSDDKILNLKTPVLFIIGQNSTTAAVDDMEEFRSKLQCKTQLLVVGGADNLLRLHHSVRMRESITQSLADRIIWNEIGSFVNEVVEAELNQPPPPVTPSTLSSLLLDSKTKREKVIAVMDKIDKASTAKRPRALAARKTPVSDVLNRGTPTYSSSSSSVPDILSMPSFNLDTKHQGISFVHPPKIEQNVNMSAMPQQQQPINCPVYTHLEFEEPGQTFENAMAAYKKMSQSSSGLPNNNSSSTFSQLSVRNGSLLLDNSENKIASTNGQLISLSPFIAQSTNITPEQMLQNNYFLNTIAQMQKQSTTRGRRNAKSGGKTNVQGPKPRRPYVRRNPVSKRNAKQQQMPTHTSNISSISMNLDTALAEVLGYHQTSSPIVSLTPDTILDLPVVFADDSLNLNK